MEFEVWQGQYFSNGMESPAGPHFKGKFKGETFKDAVIKAYKNDKDFNPETLSTWGIKIYDNESDAHDLEKKMKR